LLAPWFRRPILSLIVTARFSLCFLWPPFRGATPCARYGACSLRDNCGVYCGFFVILMLVLAGAVVVLVLILMLIPMAVVLAMSSLFVVFVMASLFVILVVFAIFLVVLLSS